MNNKIKIITLSLILSACGHKHIPGPIGQTGPKGSDGKSGKDGSGGSNGTNGHNSLISLVGSAPSCVNGGVVVISGLDLNDNGLLDSGEATASQVLCNGLDGSDGVSGSDGQDGIDGTNGVNGHNALAEVIAPIDGGGSSCTNGGVTLVTGVDLNDNTALELTEVTHTKDVCNGIDGTNGVNGLNGLNAPPTPYTPVGLVDPCGPSGGFDEVFVKMANGELVASFSDNSSGKNTRFSVIKSGLNYVTTDGDSCYFSVDALGNLFNEHH
jgi:hypothetical protein